MNKLALWFSSSRVNRGLLISLGIVLGASSLRAQTTGFSQPGAGPFDYDTATNWVGSTINGVWDPTLTLTASQSVTFDSNYGLGTGLDIGYGGNFDLKFTGDGTDRTITLGGDLTIAPVLNRLVTFGSATAGQNLNVNLGGANRTLTVGSGKAVTFFNTISNGGLTISGGNAVAAGGVARLAGAGGSATGVNVEVNLNSTLQFDDTVAGLTGGTRAQNVTLKSGGKLLVSGNSTVNSTDTLTGNLVIDGSAARARFSGNSISNVTTTPGTKNVLLTADGIQRANNATVLFRGTNLGANTIASATAGSSNIQFTGTAPAVVGGGGAVGTTNISIIPWAIGGSTSGDTGSTFVTYTAANGIRPLNTATEFATTFGNATDNVRLTSITAVASPTTANSLINTGFALSGATVTVTSGAVLLTAGGATISAGLDFGAAEGIVGYGRGNIISGPVSGTGGLTVYGLRTDESAQFTNAASTYTGNTTILSNAQVSTGFLPFGSRTGDVYVYGNLQLDVGGYNGTINGLFGNGTVSYGNSTVASLTIGDNNTSSVFTGSIQGNSNLNISKIGSGTLTFTGDHTYSRITSILGGVLNVSTLANGGTASGIGASLSTASNLVINGGTLRYSGAATSTDRLFQVGQTLSGATATLDASGTGAVNFSNAGSITYGTAGTTGSAQTRTLILTGNNTGANTLAAVIGNNGAAVNGNSNVSVTKNGAGTWVLGGANTYTGPTTINGGTLLVSGSLAAGSTVAVNSLGTLGGNNGTIAGVVNVNLGGALAPGSGLGALNTGTVNAAGGSTLAFELQTSTATADLLNITGDFNLAPTNNTFLTLTGLGLDTAMTNGAVLTLVDYSGNWNGGLFNYNGSTLADDSVFSFGANNFLANYNGGTAFTLTVTSVPEPSTYLMMGVGLIAVGLMRRRRIQA